MRRHQRKSGLSEEGQELNLIPYLDIMTNLVIFMLMTITSFLSFTILNASIPQLVTDTKQAVADATKKGPELLLMVRVTQDGYIVNPNVQGGTSLQPAEIFKTNGQYNFERLRQQIQSVKQAFPNETRVLLVAEPMIIYDDVIHTMDHIRETRSGAEDLFPDVTLSIL